MTDLIQGQLFAALLLCATIGIGVIAMAALSVSGALDRLSHRCPQCGGDALYRRHHRACPYRTERA
jgi:hypothetical protein